MARLFFVKRRNRTLVQRRKQSNNAAGLGPSHKRDQLIGMSECERALVYKHPPATLGAGDCEGLECSDVTQKQRMLNVIQSLRIDYKVERGSKVTQKLLDLLWEKHWDCGAADDVPLRLSELGWFVGTRKVCHLCWAAAAGLLTQPNHDRRKTRHASKQHCEGSAAHVPTRSYSDNSGKLRGSNHRP